MNYSKRMIRMNYSVGITWYSTQLYRQTFRSSKASNYDFLDIFIEWNASNMKL